MTVIRLGVWLLLAALSLSAQGQGQGALRVGVYQNAPSVFYDDGGKVRGFYIDILEYVAQQEGWALRYVKDTWPGLIRQLQAGSIDMIAGMAYDPVRQRRYDFTREPVFINWGQVYVGDKGLQSILDLKNRRVAGLKQDIYTLSFQALLRQFDLPVTFNEVDSYEAVMQQVEAGQADAGITSRSNGKRLEGQYQVYRSPIVCCSKDVHYAVLKGHHEQYLQGIDQHLQQLKADNNSFYFQSLDRWYGEERGQGIPEWLYWLLVATLGGLVILMVGVLVLRRQVRERTAKLQQAHDSLEYRVTQRTSELYEKNQQLLNEIYEHRKTQRRLQYLVSHDPLTGLPNRRWFSEQLAEDIKRARRDKHRLAVLFLDLDGFKQTNDSYGHDFGDLVLIRAAERIRRCLRDSDKLARLGGDEFIVILPEVESCQAAEVVARKVLQCFSEPFESDGKRCHIGISIGISLLSEQGEVPEVLLSHADDAMYCAKKGGRNRYRVYEEDGLGEVANIRKI